MQITSKRYPAEQREPAAKVALDHLGENGALYAVCQSIGPKPGAASLRQSTRQAMIEADQAPRVTSAEPSRARISNGGFEISRKPARS